MPADWARSPLGARKLMPILISIGTFVSTLLGGLLALHLKDRLHLMLGFSAGALIGVALFELIPEERGLASRGMSGRMTAGLVGAGFFLYMILDRTMAPHGAKAAPIERLWRRGALGAGSLSLHSFLDGFSIGIAFKVSPAIGFIVSVAVLAHDFSDGINTVSIILRNQSGTRSALRWLLLDAAAPVAGAAAAMVLEFPPDALGPCLALFAGIFLY